LREVLPQQSGNRWMRFDSDGACIGDVVQTAGANVSDVCADVEKRIARLGDLAKNSDVGPVELSVK